MAALILPLRSLALPGRPKLSLPFLAGAVSGVPVFMVQHCCTQVLRLGGFRAELVDHRRFGISRYPPLQLLDRDKTLAPAPDDPQPPERPPDRKNRDRPRLAAVASAGVKAMRGIEVSSFFAMSIIRYRPEGQNEMADGSPVCRPRLPNRGGCCPNRCPFAEIADLSGVHLALHLMPEEGLEPPTRGL
jgi:hypothetical protein